MSKPLPRHIATTRWSLLNALRHHGPQRTAALEELFSLYWYSVYAFIRRSGWRHDDAVERTQGFFAMLLEEPALEALDRKRGKFRSWLFKVLDRYMISARRSETAAKRDRRRTDWLDFNNADATYALESGSDGPEQLYNRTWSYTQLGRALAQLEQECSDEGRAQLFRHVKPLLVGPDGDDPSYAPLATALGVAPGYLKTNVYRLRQRFGVILRQQLADLCESPEQVEEELDFLLGSLSQGQNGSG